MQRARVIKAARETTPVTTSPTTARVVRKDEIDAREKARAILEEAKQQAARIVDEARAAVKDISERAMKEAEENAQAKLSAAWLALRAREEKRAEAELERTVGLATVLAERLLGAALEVDPTKAADLAKQALLEARGARRATILAHPRDAEAIAGALDKLGMPEGSVDVVADDTLARGSLAVQTELGTIDGRLRPQLERLATALQEALRS